MIKKLLATFCLLLFMASTSAYAQQLKIGYMNTQEVLGGMPGRTDVQQKLSSFVQEKQQELQQRTTAFQDSVAAFQQSQESMTEQQVEQEQQKLAEMEASIRQFQQNLQQQVQQQRTTLLNPLYEKIDQAIAAVAEEMELDFVLNESTTGGENVIYYASEDELNITQNVLKQIKTSSE